LAGNRNSVPDQRNWITGKENSAGHNGNSTAKTDDGVSVRKNPAGRKRARRGNGTGL